jgi:hypothetical protein
MWAVRKEPSRMSVAEIYKGIEFVRISNLPEEQKSQITQTIDHSKIIKILRGKELLPDCVQVNDYSHWMAESFNKSMVKDLGKDHQIPAGTISTILPRPSSK